MNSFNQRTLRGIPRDDTTSCDRELPNIKSQIRLPCRFIRTVATPAICGKDRLDFRREIGLGGLALAPCVARANQGQECRAYNGWNSKQCLHHRWNFWFEFG